MTDEKVKDEARGSEEIKIEDLAPAESEQAEVKGGVPGGGIWISPGAH